MNRVPASADRQLGSVAELRGVYAVTPDDTDTGSLVRKVRMALAGGVSAVQYRNKPASAALRRDQGWALLALCRSERVPLIINDDLDLAEALGADGVHLGREDMPIAAARARLGRGKLLGASCYDRLDLAVKACSAGADYVAFGSAFPSLTKPGATRAPLSLYREAKARLACPIVAIGGITSGNAPVVIGAGADAVAVISALFDAPDVERSARQFAGLFSAHDLEKRSAV
ncbi:MAG TPA: thiamine phosphate synthase [Burkholderiales bacterium]|nr:thiamine phosphate synthase [Burkholderiales bacterium]